MNTALAAYRAARDFLFTHRTDYVKFALRLGLLKNDA